MAFQYQHPQFYLAFVVVPAIAVLFWFLIKWKKKAAARIGDERLVGELTASHSRFLFFVKFVFILISVSALLMAMINPQLPGKMDKVERKGVDVMIALDVSNSMLAEDIKPNRLEKAKQVVMQMMGSLEEDRVGLVLFAGRAYMQMPLTTDHSAARMYIQNAGPGVVPTQGTMVSEALRLCASGFNSKERKYKTIVLITDGEDHDPSTLTVAQELATNGVMVNTIGIGSGEGTPIPDPSTGQYKQDDAGNTIISKLNEGQLRQLASLTKGIYVGPDRLNDASAEIMKKLSTIQETALEDSAFKDYIHYFPWLATLALLFLLAEFFLPEKKFKTA